MQFPINTGPKEDHPTRLANLVGVDPKYYYKAEELKLYENAINELYSLLGTSNSNGNKVIDYTLEWIPGTYTYKITVRKYIFNGVLHTNTIYFERTLGASDLVYNRFDSFLIDANEQIIVWPGDAVEFPYPKEFDLDTYVLINFVRVDANTTAPTGHSEILVFNEGTGAPGEWAINYLSGTLSTEHPSLDLKSIKLVNKQAVMAISPVPYEGRFLKDLLIDVTCYTAAANNRLRFSFWIADTMRVGEVYVTHGTFNFDAFLVGVPQTIVIPGSAFVNGGTWGNFQYDSLWMNNDKTGTIVYLDNVRIQQTESEQVSGTNHTHAQLSVLETITQALINAWNAAVLKLSTIEANATADQTGAEIKALYEAEADTNAFTDAEKTKLANAETPHFKGLHTSEAALIIAHPAGVSGDFADVDAGIGADVARWIWDISDDKWVVQSGVIAGETSASIKAKYEANADTNAFTDAEKIAVATNTEKVGVQSDIIGMAELKPELNGRVDMVATTIINWSLGVSYLHNTLTANATFMDSNLPQGTDTKTISLDINLSTFTLTLPTYYVFKGGIASATGKTRIIIDCVNGIEGSQEVYYTLIPNA